MLAHHGLGGAVGPDHQQPCRFAALREHREQIDGGRVGPVQVLEYEHQGDVGRQRFDEGGELAQHALGSHGLQRLPQRLLIAVADQPGDLRQPRRRDTAEQPRQAAGVGPVRQPLQRLDHRQICFTRSVLLDAEPPRNPYRRLRIANRRRIEKGLHQGGLADARRAGDEDDLPLAGARPREQRREPP